MTRAHDAPWLRCHEFRVSKSDIGSVCIIVFRRSYQLQPSTTPGIFPAQRVLARKTDAAHLEFPGYYPRGRPHTGGNDCVYES